MGDGCRIGKSSFRYNRNIISVQRKDSQILEATKGVLLDTLQLVVRHYQGCQSTQVGKDKRGQHRYLVIAQVPEMNGLSMEEFIAKIIKLPLTLTN